MGHGRIFLSVDLDRPNCFSSICGMEGLLSGLLPQVSQPKRNSKQSPGKSEGTTQTMVKIWGLGAWQAPYAVPSSSHSEAILEDWAQAEVHNVCL